MSELISYIKDLLSRKASINILIKIPLIIILIIFVFGDRGLINLYLAQKNLDVVKKDIADLNDKTELQNQLSKYSESSEKIEYHARENLGLAKVGDIIVYLNKKNE